MERPALPAELARRVKVEAGHRCAIHTCKQTPVEIAHIVPWSEVREHRFDNLVALCPTCHTRFDRGEIDRQSMRVYKANLVAAERPGRPGLPGAWTSVAPMRSARSYHSISLIEPGVLVITGDVSGQATECYEPHSEIWTGTAPLIHARRRHTATVLLDGRVLVAGGLGMDGIGVASVEIYDSQRDTWEVIGTVHETRFAHSATRLPDGRVVIAGGYDDLAQGRRVLRRSTEVFTPVTCELTPGPPLAEARADHTAHLVQSHVVVLGGDAGLGMMAAPERLALDVDLWESIAAPNYLRRVHASAMVGSRIFVVGGIGTPDPAGLPDHTLRSAEAYDPEYGDWSELPPLTLPRSSFTITAFGDDRALIVGGCGQVGNHIWSSAEYLQVGATRIGSVGRMREPRSAHATVRLTNGAVLVTGGQNLRGALASTELFVPAANTG